MAHNIIEGLDAGLLEGNEPTWHGMKEYKLMGDEPITPELVAGLVDYDVTERPLYLMQDDGLFSKADDMYAVCRKLSDGRLFPLGRAVGRRYTVFSRKDIVRMVDEFLLQKFPTLKFCGAGTFGGGRTFWFQLNVEDYHVHGDQSDHELRLTYSDSYNDTAHRIGCTSVRVVCNNTLRAGFADAIARNMFSSIRHTAGSGFAIEAKMEEFAKIHLGLTDEIALLESLTTQEVDSKYLDHFLEEMLPMPKEPEKHVVTVNRVAAGRAKITELFERSGETMDQRIATSKYALLQSFTDYQDHHSYYRSPGLRWQEGLDGFGADEKDRAKALLLTA